MKAKYWRIVCILTLVIVVSCSYTTHLGIHQQLASPTQRPKLIAQLQQEPTDDKDNALRLLSLGMALRFDNQYASSVRVWEEAKQVIAQQRAISISEGISQFLINNTTSSFALTATEEQTLHIFQAANFLDQNQKDSARVEVLQREQLIKEYPPEFRFPFADYFAGIVFEHLQEPDFALVSYRRAYQAYQAEGAVPRQLVQDYIRLLNAQGATDELERLTLAHPEAYTATQPNLTLIIAYGWVPEKEEKRIIHFAPEYQDSFSIVLPDYAPSAPLPQLQISTNQQPVVPTLVSNLATRVRYELALHHDLLVAQALVRQIAKIALAREIGNKVSQREQRGFFLGDFIIDLLFTGLVHASESADLRSWNTLPAGFYLYRTYQPPGTYRIETPGANPLTLEITPHAPALRLVHFPNA